MKIVKYRKLPWEYSTLSRHLYKETISKAINNFLNTFKDSQAMCILDNSNRVSKWFTIDPCGNSSIVL